MFSAFENLKKIREMQQTLENEKVVVEKDGISVKVSGKMEVEEISLNSSLSFERQEKLLKECINEAFKKVKEAAARKLFQEKP